MCFFSKLIWVGILQAYLPKDLGLFGEKTPLNRPKQFWPKKIENLVKNTFVI
jgi:hypothetical protein